MRRRTTGGARTATYQDIARAARVSTATVSRVLAGSGQVSDERRERVLAVADGMSYRPTKAARTLRRQQADTLGLIVSDVEYPFVASVARAIENAAAARGYALAVCNSDENLARERTYIDLLIEEQVAGVIISPSTEDSGILEPLQRAGIPTVTLDRRLEAEHVDNVLLDNAEATLLLMADLIAHGHRHFAAVVGTTAATPSRERLDAMRSIIETIPGGTLTVAGSRLGETIGLRQTLATVGRSVLSLTQAAHPAPTAYICANAIMLTSLLEALHDSHIEVPGDVAVVGFDDMPGFALFAAPVTVVAQPTSRIADTAIDLLFSRITQPDLPSRTVLVAPELILRRSCGHPSAPVSDDFPRSLPNWPTDPQHQEYS